MRPTILPQGQKDYGMTVRQTIKAVFSEVAAAQSRQMPPLHDQLQLLDSGLDSLCFTLIFERLEDELGKDPFANDVDFPETFGAFVALYEAA
jgi:aryl carrier-like protein